MHDQKYLCTISSLNEKCEWVKGVYIQTAQKRLYTRMECKNKDFQVLLIGSLWPTLNMQFLISTSNSFLFISFILYLAGSWDFDTQIRSLWPIFHAEMKVCSEKRKIAKIGYINKLFQNWLILISYLVLYMSLISLSMIWFTKRSVIILSKNRTKNQLIIFEVLYCMHIVCVCI